MPTPITHVLAAAAVGLSGAAVMRLDNRADSVRLVASCVAAAVLPDFDALAAFLPNRMQPIWGHRGIFHSPLFAIIIGFLLSRRFTARLMGGRAVPAAFLTVAVAGVSHSILDAMTDAGFGVILYAPFDFGRYFLPWRIIHAARPDTLAELNFGHIISAIKSELFWWILFTALCVFNYTIMLRRRGKCRA